MDNQEANSTIENDAKCNICDKVFTAKCKVDTVSLSRIWSNEKMNQVNGYWSSPDHYWGNQMAQKIEIFNDPFLRKLRLKYEIHCYGNLVIEFIHL